MIGLAALAALAVTAQGQSIDSYVQKNFEDANFTARVKFANQKELSKINKDFGQSYRFSSVEFKVKEPFKVRADANVEDTKVLYITNGTKQLIRIPRIKVNSHQDLSKSPGRRQTLLDFGVLTPSLFDDFFVAKFVRMDRATGDAVFDLTYVPALDDTTRHRIWVDPQKKYVTRREWYSQRGGKQLATFYYTDPVNAGGVWMPSHVSVKNVEGVLAGETYYDGLKINSGIPDSLFSTN